MGNKVSDISTMNKAGIPTVPGLDGVLNQEIATRICYQAIVKETPGGGHGMRVTHKGELIQAIEPHSY